MQQDLQDTIVALSSAVGPGLRSIVRLSGDNALTTMQAFCQTDEPMVLTRRFCYSGNLKLPEMHTTMPVDVYVWPASKTYTGQLLVEVHTLCCPPITDLLIAHCLASGVRAAQPGEFTMRAFLSGKLDLTQAEAVLAVIEADNRDELQQALRQMAGGMAQPLHTLRSDLLDLLADVEAGLDFSDEDLQFVETDDMLHRLGHGLAMLTTLRQQLDRRSFTDHVFRIVLAGLPNAGKSSLFNALGEGKAIVSHEPGTTRDYLVEKLDFDGIPVELVDTAGWEPTTNGIAHAAQELGQAQLEKADLVLLCVPGVSSVDTQLANLQKKTKTEIVAIATKCDSHAYGKNRLATSALTGQGLPELKELIREKARDHSRPNLAPSLARCRGHIDTAISHLRTAHHLVLESEAPELIALELRLALEQIGEMVGAIYTDDLLDRIFSRFCIGK